VPERKLAMTFSFRRNTGQGPAGHPYRRDQFKLPRYFFSAASPTFPASLMKQRIDARGAARRSGGQGHGPGYYLIGLSNQEADKERNLNC